MNFAEKILNKIFPKNQVSHPPQKFRLSRTEQEIQLQKYWEKSERSQKLLEELENAYQLSKVNIKNEYNLHLLQTPTANGIALSFQENLFDKEEFQYLLDLFKNRLLTIGYSLQVSEKILEDKGSFVLIKEKYYLKPSIFQQIKNQEKANQRYGNITLEVTWTDQAPQYLKILSTIYFDRNFTEAKTFEDLLEILFMIEK